MTEIKKTGYDWSVEANIRILDLENWDTEESSYEDSYYQEPITAKEFYRRIGLCRVKANSMPRKTEMYLEYRMYGLVPYNLSPIQQGIQYGHAVVEYGRLSTKFGGISIYNKWADNDKTFIILNGGTTNTNPDRLGTLNKDVIKLHENNVACASFFEPDLGDQLTAVVFLVDERIFNRELYPDFVGSPYPWPSNKKPSEKEFSKWEVENNKNYEKWVEKIGGPKNVFLRDFLRTKKLA